MLYKYHPPVINSPSPQSMPQLDFRAALSTPEEKLLSPPTSPNVAAVPMSAIAKSPAKGFLRGAGFSRSTWANVVFVAIASVGGLVCAFYFFNGGELVRAAASWPSEYLYPRPLSTDKLDNSQPNPVDHFSQNDSSDRDASVATSKKSDPQESVNQPFLASNRTSSTTTTEPTNPGSGPIPPGPVIIIPPTVPPILPIPPSPPSLFDDLNTFVSGVDGQIQSLYQGATSTVSTTLSTTTTTVKQTTKKTISSARRKASSTQQKVATSANSTARNLQQTTSQTQITQMSMNTVRPVNQMMSGGGMGGGMGGIGGGGIGAGAGGAGAGAGAVGGALGGLGGVGGAGLGGGISGGLGGLGGGVGGLLGGHH